MDLTSAVGSVFAAFGLSAAAGLNAWLPVLASALLARWGVVDLGAPFEELSTDTGLVVLGVLTAADFVGDKVPAVDHALHALGGVVHPVAGAVLFTGQTGIETDIPDLVAIVAGALTAGSVHGARAAIRPVSTVSTAGIGNPALSLGEDAGSLALTAISFALPVLAFVLVLALLAGLVLAARRLRGALRRPPG